jgi:ABC-type transport system involved in Fe-S cluster assembly fused permease/ATPase subunit
LLRNSEESEGISQINCFIDGIGFTIISVLSSVSFYIFLVLVSLEYLTLYSFVKLGEGVVYQVLSTLVMFMMTAIPTIIWRKRSSRVKKNSRE